MHKLEQELLKHLLPRRPSVERGNIDLYNRPSVPAPEGGRSTVRTIGIEEDGREVNIPTVVGSRVVSDDEAVAEYRRTGKHLGKYPTRKLAASMARKLHGDYAAGLYSRKK